MITTMRSANGREWKTTITADLIIEKESFTGSIHWDGLKGSLARARLKVEDNKVKSHFSS